MLPWFSVARWVLTIRAESFWRRCNGHEIYKQQSKLCKMPNISRFISSFSSWSSSCYSFLIERESPNWELTETSPCSLLLCLIPFGSITLPFRLHVCFCRSRFEALQMGLFIRELISKWNQQKWEGMLTGCTHLWAKYVRICIMFTWSSDLIIPTLKSRVLSGPSLWRIGHQGIRLFRV